MDQATTQWLEDRGLEPELADRYGWTTANIKNLRGGSVLKVPYFEHGQVVNEKFRVLPKERFWQNGSKRIFWNSDVLDDPLLESGSVPLIITEGELDALACIQCGFLLSVSVPDGAPPPSQKDKLDEFSGSDDQTGKFEFIWRAADKLKKVKRFVLAVDNDGPGQRLQEELLRRLSPARCSFVEYPVGCKDINDVLAKHGAEAVVKVINQAKQFPVRGLYKISDYPEQGELQTYSSGWPPS